MNLQPTLDTERLILRPWKSDDVPGLQQLAGRREIADTMISVPHPFTRPHAENWIADRAKACTQGKGFHFAITLRGTGSLVGSVELRAVDAEHCHAELSCWIGVEFWGQGLATETARAVLHFGFEQLNLNRIAAFYMVRDPASGRVLERVGLKREGLLRQCVSKWGHFEDVVPMAILRQDWPVQSG